MSLLGSKERGAKEIATDGHNILAVALVDHERHIVCGSQEGALQRWQIEDAWKVTTTEASSAVYSVAVSKDGKWIVTGGCRRVVVWNATTHAKVVEATEHTSWVSAIDVSSNSETFASGSDDKTVQVFNITSGQRLVGPIQHESYVNGVKFSPRGDHLATATVHRGVRVFDAFTGDQLLSIPIPIARHPSTPLAWSSDRNLFAVSPGRITHLNVSTTSVSEWLVHNTSNRTSIATSGTLIACSAGSSVSFWDTVSHKQIGPVIEHAGIVQCIALSQDGMTLVCGTDKKKISVHPLCDMFPKSYFAHDLPLMHISVPAFESWTQENFMDAEAIVSEEILWYPTHHAFANRALVRAHSRDWSASIDDAQKSLQFEPSPVGHIAQALALIGQGQHAKALWTFDLAFRDCNPNDNRFLLLLKSILLFMSGKHDDAISRVLDLIPTKDDVLTYCCARVLGNMYLNAGDLQNAVESLRRTQLRVPTQRDSYSVTISLIFGRTFDGADFTFQQRLCEALHVSGKTTEAADILTKLISKVGERTQTNKANADWVADFTKRCLAKCESMGDEAFDVAKPVEANAHYTAALSLDPLRPASLLLKRSSARAAFGLWEGALQDANEAIRLDASCPRGYERKYVALHGAQRHDEAIDAYSSMLSAIESSPIPDISQLHQTYISPSQTVAVIDETLQEIFNKSPLVLIDVKTGCLCDVSKRASIFKGDPAFKELVSSTGMTREIDFERIKQTIAKYFRYVMFSHVWEGKEPSFQEVNLAESVWRLDSTMPLNDKLQKFCVKVLEEGYRWAWCDTCCIDKLTSSILNQSLTSMYKWYEDSAATLVLLAGVASPSKLGDLARSLWMTRAWTVQELLAPKVIRFFDSEWNPYLGDTRTNHKESPEIIQELSSAIHIPSGTIVSFRPDDLGVADKLRLASTRNAKIEEDTAYSLIGIFKSDIRPHYGEREAALGNLLQEVVARSGDVTVLAWHGKSSSFNSCLPSSLAVYSRSPFTPPHIPQCEIERRVANLRSSLPEEQAMEICNLITRLPPARFANRRLHLPCVALRVKSISSHRGNLYRAKVPGLGKVEFVTADLLPLTEPQKLIFVHPWIRDIRGPHNGVDCQWEDDLESDTDSVTEWGNDVEMEVDSDSRPSSPSNSVPPALPDACTRAFQLIARLGGPFNALLLLRQPDGEFRRVAAEQEIVVPGLGCNMTSLRGIHAEVVDVL